MENNQNDDSNKVVNPENPNPLQTPIPTQPLQQPQVQQTYPNPTEPRKRKAFPIILLILVLILICITGFLVYKNHHNTTTISTSKTTTSSSSNQSQSQSTSPILTYQTTGTPQSFIVTNSSNNTLTKVPMPTGKNTFNVVTKGPTDLLLEASGVNPADKYTTDGIDHNSDFIDVSYNGTSTTLPTATDTILNTNVPVGGSLTDHQLFYVTCDTQHCYFNQLNLETGINNILITQPYTSDTEDNSDASMYLMGVNNGFAYLLENSQTAPGSVHKFDIASDKDQSTWPMKLTSLNTPVLSNSGSEAIYSGPASSGNLYIMSMTNGSTRTIDANLTADDQNFVWSPNDDRIAISSGTVDTTVSQDELLQYLDVATGNIVLVKDFGDAHYNNVTVNSWISDNELSYNYATTTSENDFINSGTDGSINVISQAVTATPDPAGYEFLPVDRSTYFNP